MAPVSLEGLLVLHGVIEFKQIFETNKMKVKTQQQNLIQGLDLSYQCITTELRPLGNCQPLLLQLGSTVLNTFRWWFPATIGLLLSF